MNLDRSNLKSQISNFGFQILDGRKRGLVVFDQTSRPPDDIHVANTIPLSTHSLHADTSTASPPWHLIHFDVHCARCGHDLRGQAEPVCPACQLEFSWADAAPLEQLTCGKCNYHLYGLTDSRCPECGTAVDWNTALLRYRTAQKPLFEYRWRDRPIRSFVRTWFLALRPGKLWRSVQLYDPPRLAPLAVWTVVILACTDVLIPLALGSAAFLAEWWSVRVRRVSVFSDMPTFILHYLLKGRTHTALILYAWWCILTFGALGIFRQSMRKYKVRTAHVARVWAYASAAFIPLAVFGFLATFVYAEALSARGGWQRRISRWWLYDDTYLFFALAALLHMTWAIRQGYRHYLRIPHSIGVAIAAQVIAALGVMIAYARLLMG
jgi:hypothetical protein